MSRSEVRSDPSWFGYRSRSIADRKMQFDRSKLTFSERKSGGNIEESATGVLYLRIELRTTG
ncbi:hypothetical protein BRD17_02305 [Halobacteriales archaeon SW_7_68_16]|nr:MAG: hypothetical protein BRD17_02305 [Halobacteriales archaeon SW_7_68_16]